MLAEELQLIIESAVKALGCDLWGAEWVIEGKNKVLRVYVDSPNGVTLGQCARISRQISAAFDVEENLIKGQYYLEVSSPGMERPLFTVEQYRRYLGKTIAIRLRAPKAGRRKFSGILIEANEDKILLKLDDQTEVEFTWRDVDKAHVVVINAFKP